MTESRVRALASARRIALIAAAGIPLVAGFDWAYDLTEPAAAPIDAPGVAYVTHPYPQKRPQPWEDQWQADWGFMAERYPGISWIAWVFDPVWSPQLIESWDFTPTPQGQFFRQKLMELNQRNERWRP